MRFPRSALLLTALICSPVAYADTFTYNVNDVYANFTLVGTITTNSNSGTIGTSNIVGFSVTSSDGLHSELLNSANSRVLASGSALTATASALTFDYASDVYGIFLFQLTPNTTGSNYVCYEDAAGGCDSSGAHESIRIGSDATAIQPFNAARVIASSNVAVTPEPGSLILLSTGLMGTIGAVWNRRRTLARYLPLQANVA